ncbi:MAG: diguanylate cyclase [Alphaproteobacteria bacterium HGW-Alphaproteobacteria-6]|nr:MAG: diguanylate cyclase [Alphaproteobacteria bacterium HGW-Alphaproteobacteria-6]
MTDEIDLAFAHPEARAAAMAAGAPLPPDRISLRDHVVMADIGAFGTERGQKQRLRFDIAVDLAPCVSDAGDDVDRILSYDRLTEAVADALAERRLDLLETLAEAVAARILAQPQAGRVYLRIEKLDRGPGALGVAIVRARATGAAPAPAPTEAAAPRPVLAVFDSAALGAADLARRLDALAATGGAVLIAVTLPDGLPVAPDPVAQARIDLLGLEQNAWALAARDARLSVVASRTEMDWAIRQGAMVVWAPGKLVLDAPDAPQGPVDPGRLAAWLAARIGATMIVLHGTVAIPADCRVTVTRA